MFGSVLGRRVALSVATSVLSVVLPTAAFAAAVTPATGGSAISNGTVSNGSYTPLTGPTVTAVDDTDMTNAPTFGTLILNAPIGFEFDTGGTAPTLLVTCTSNCASSNNNVNNLTSGSTIAVTRTTSQLTVTISDDVDGAAINTLTWQNVRVRPTAALPLATGNLVISGATGFVGMTGSTNFGTLTEVAAANVVTPATGGSAIASDTVGGTFTSLTGPVLSETYVSSILEGTIVLNAPAGFEFDTGGTAPTVLMTRTAGSSTGTDHAICNINNVLTGTSISVSSVTSSQITFIVDDESRNGTTGDGVCTGILNSLTWQNVRVRPTGSLTSLPSSADIVVSGTAPLAGVTGVTNFGTLTEVKSNTTTGVVTSGTPSVYGDNVTFTATVSGGHVPSGTVEFYDGATLLGTDTLDGSYQATFTLSTLAFGAHTTVHAIYLGDGENNGSTSGNITQTVTAKTLIVTPDAQTKLYGDADPAFTVTGSGFVNGDTVGTVITGSPARTMLELVGSYPFTVGTLATNANYSMTFNAGNALAINPKPLTLTADDQTRAYGTANPTLTYTTTPFAFAETIAALGGTLVVSTTANVNSVVGTYPISISGVTSTNYAITFTPGTLTVNQGTTTTNTIVDTPTPNSEVGTSVQLDATVNGYNPTGTVTFYSGATVLGTASVVSNVATINHTFTLAGDYTIHAVYAGDTNNTGSTGSTTIHIVDKDAAHTVTTLSSTNPQIVGQNITFTATVTGAYGPTGTVEFYDGAMLIGSDTLDGSFQADFTTNGLGVGVHTISAFYLGDSNNEDSTGSTQVNVNQTIDKDTPDTVTTVSATNPQIVGQNVTFTATVAGAFNPTGTVEFYDGAVFMGSGSLNGSFEATFTTNTLTVGTHTISAFYLGDGNNNDSTGSVEVNVDQDIIKDSPTTSTVLDVFDPSTIGDPVTLTATVSGGFTPSGDVEFFANGSSLGTAPLVGNTATLIVSTLAVGTHTLEAEYLGDGNNNGSTSPSVEMHVVQQMTSTSLFASLLSPNSVHVALSMNVTVTGFNPTGIVEFYQDGVLIGAAPLIAGSAFLQTLPSLGSHTMHAVYLGDINNTSSTSGSQSVQIIDTPDNNSSEDGGGAAGTSNGSGRGSGAGNLSSLAAFTAGTYGFDQSAPPAFGGDDAPLSTQELSYICSMQRAIGTSASDEVMGIVADVMSEFMGRTSEFLAEQLADPVLCAGISMSLRGGEKLASQVLTAFPVDRNGNPVSTNATWNACILGYVTLEDIRSNPDRNEYRRAGVSNPLTCGHYVTKGVWKHPDLDVYFSFDRATKLLTLPEGYFAVIKEYATR